MKVFDIYLFFFGRVYTWLVHEQNMLPPLRCTDLVDKTESFVPIAERQDIPV